MKFLQYKNIYLFLSFLAGAITLMYEIYSLKIIHFYIPKSDHAISITLAAFLAGLAFSSLLFSQKVQKKKIQGKKLIIILYAISAIYTLLILKNVHIIPHLFDYIHNILPENGVLFASIKLSIIFTYLFIPAFLLGGTFPIFNGLYQKNHSQRYKDTGTIYFYDTLGAIFGSLVAGFLIIPKLGIQNSLLIPIILSGCTSVIIAKKRQSKLILVLLYSLIIGLFLNIFSFSNINIHNKIKSKHIPYETKFGDILFQENSEYGVITVGEKNNNRILFINYREMCSHRMKETESELGRLATNNLEEEDLNILNIGLGCGFTARAILENEKVKDLKIIEINQKIIEINQEFFGLHNNNVLKNTKVNIANENGVEFLREENTQEFDAIIIDIEEPSVIQSSPIYTVEYMEFAKEKLSENGIFALWAIEGGSHVYNQILFNTLREVFPYVYIKYTNSVQLYASNKPLDIISSNTAHWDQNMKTINTLDNRALEKVFNIYEIFNIPDNYKDEFVRE